MMVTTTTTGTKWVLLFLLIATSATIGSVYSLSMPPSNKNKVYDIVVIGGGSAGLTAAKFGATFGKSVALVEKHRLGGDCTWTGCVPSKTLIAESKKKTSSSSSSPKLLQNYKHDNNEWINKVRNRLDKTRQTIYDKDDSKEVLEQLGIDCFEGNAFLVSSSLVEIQQQQSSSSFETDKNTQQELQLQAKYGIMIASGASPRPPDDTQIKGLASVDYVTYEEIFELEHLPKKLTVVGGGPVGCELSQALARLGSNVTQIAPRLLPNEEDEIGDALEALFEAEGITRIKATVVQAQKEGTGGHVVSCKQAIDGSDVSVSGDLLLLAVGRIPNVKGMGLQELGVLLNVNGGIMVDKNLQTTVKGIYAAGDCTGDKQFTHYAGYQGAIAARNILLPLADPGVLDTVPAATFTTPEIASVGLTEARAKELHGDNNVDISIKYLEDSDRAICEGTETSGLIKIVYHAKNYKIFGASIMSPAAAELIGIISVAMKTKLTFDMLATVTQIYPSYSSELQIMAADVYYSKLTKNKRLYNTLKRVGL